MWRPSGRSTARTGEAVSRAPAKPTSSTWWRPRRPTTAGCVQPRRWSSRRFASDLLNLTRAAQRVNRHVAGCTPAVNACWFVARTLEVRRTYGLTIDRVEAAAAEKVLAGCDDTGMAVVACAPATRPPLRGRQSILRPAETWAPSGCGTNGNGRITCAEARRYGIAPVPRSHPAASDVRSRRLRTPSIPRL